MQTFPSVFFDNVLSKFPAAFHAEGKNPAFWAGLQGNIWMSGAQAAPSPGRVPPALTAPV